MRKFGAFFASMLLVVCFAGCSPAETSSGAASLGDITNDDFYDALYLMPTEIDPNSSIEGGLSIQADPFSKEVRMEFVSSADDVQVACADAEAIVKIYDLSVLQARADRAEDEGDEQAAEQWQAARGEDEASEGLGRLYDEYTLYVVLDNEEGTLDLTGLREAGSEGGINWQ